MIRTLETIALVIILALLVAWLAVQAPRVADALSEQLQTAAQAK